MLAGQLTMKLDARVKTEVGSRGCHEYQSSAHVKRHKGSGKGKTYSSIRARERHLTNRSALVAGVQRLGNKDGASDRQVRFAGDQWGAAEVGGCTDTLDDAREGDE